MKKTSATKYETAVPTSRKVLGVLALVGLFTCGVFVGTTLNDNRTPNADGRIIAFSESDCYAIINKIKAATDADLLEELKDIYNDNCAGRAIDVKSFAQENDNDADDAPVATCGRIEQLLAQQLMPEEDSNAYAHLNNANTYARMAERGCPENADKYRALAAREIEITTALEPVEYMPESRVENVIDVYKKVKMRAAAQQVIDTLQKVSEPTIDFILKLEKIVNEE